MADAVRQSPILDVEVETRIHVAPTAAVVGAGAGDRRAVLAVPSSVTAQESCENLVERHWTVSEALPGWAAVGPDIVDSKPAKGRV
jgi:hypothetical protein